MISTDSSIETILACVTEQARTTAHIKEETCIGCFKCINACPVDAIIGAPQKMHTVLTENCIGCDLCIEACPVDCILAQPYDQAVNAKLAKQHNTQKLERLKNLSDYDKQIYAQHTFQESTTPIADKKAAIAAAVARANKKD